MSNPLKIAKNLLYILQVEEYHLGRFWRWLKTHSRWTDLERKKKLVWTPKATLLFFLTLGLWLSASAGFLLLVRARWQSWGALAAGVVLLVILAKSLISISLVFATVLLQPAVWLVTLVLARRAKEKREMLSPLKVIGISGSFGKTSVKEILSHILSSKYKVLKTPENINTLLGISRLILRELNPEHHVFIAEIGAYKRGDTRAVAKLISPGVGILVGINEQHLERFGSMENIIATESELLEELPRGGIAVLNRDDRYYHEAAAHVPQTVRKVDFSLEEERAGEFALRTLEVIENGTSFFLEGKDGKYFFETRLLGKHNVSNVLAALFAAEALGMTFQEIGEALRTIGPLQHRLQPIIHQLAGGGDIIILDDSYNVNPDGARAALEVLSLFKDRRKIVITHGLVELGAMEEDINRNFGRALAKIADIVIAAGPQAPLIEEGLRSTGLLGEKLVRAQNITEAIERFRALAKPGDVILLQTDLPDSYFP